MPDGLYDSDALAWAETQAGLLRRLAMGERVNEQIDWLNVIEEVGDVGKLELRACESSLIQALSHLLKFRAWPASTAVRRWREETGNFIDDAQRSFTPSMRQKTMYPTCTAPACAVSAGQRTTLGSLHPSAILAPMPWTTC